jgi:hypothetical protein
LIGTLNTVCGLSAIAGRHGRILICESAAKPLLAKAAPTFGRPPGIARKFRWKHARCVRTHRGGGMYFLARVFQALAERKPDLDAGVYA